VIDMSTADPDPDPEYSSTEQARLDVGLPPQDAVERKPRSARAAALYRLPTDVSFPEASVWALTAHERDSQRVLEWLERAKARGAIVTQGAD
jgi:hypothetical protein